MSPSDERRATTAAASLGVLATTAVILPAFLTGAVAVQIREDLVLGESAIGLAIGAFFVGSSLGSTGLGRLAERLGPVLAIRLGLGVTAIADVAIAGLVDGTATLATFLVVAGLANALVQPAINLLVVRVVAPARLGFVMALKQSGMPAAALLGGLAVPSIALTVGWRAAYVGAGVLAMVPMLQLQTIRSILSPPGVTSDPGSDEQGPPDRVGDERGGGDRPGRTRPRPDQRLVVLVVMAAVGVLGGGAANIVVGYLVSGAVDAGIDAGAAGLVLTVGSALGIASRLVHGWLADRGRIEPLGRVVGLLAAGLAGAALLAVHQPIAYLVATPIVFAGGWAWPGLFNLVVVQANRSAPAAATGITQTGVYVGSVLGPIIAGALIETSGYRAAWLLTAAALGAAALATLAVRAQIGPSSGSGVERPLARG